MAHVLIVPALELRDPVLLVVAVEADDAFFHARAQPRVGLGAGA